MTQQNKESAEIFADSLGNISVQNIQYRNAERFINIYINNLIQKFRFFNTDKFTLRIHGLENFVKKHNDDVTLLINHLNAFDFQIEIEGKRNNIEKIEIECVNNNKDESYVYEYHIQNLPSLFELSSECNISIVGLIIMKIVSQTILKQKILYKAIVFDLDDTLWYGTLSEDGIEKIKTNMNTSKGKSFIRFMNFIRILANELGIFIALCSRNSLENVKNAIEELDESIFPLKKHIDCIIANYNDKSDNLKLIANKLSILPQSMIFIDDNPIINDEVKDNIPEIFVPIWENHADLTTILLAGCFFERNELSIISQERRKQFEILENERQQNRLPDLGVRVFDDLGHIESKRLYAKTNQFKFSQNNDDFKKMSKSFCFEIYRKTGDFLGISSSISISIENNCCHIHNWAISCRYFEIGLEEFVLIYLHKTFKIKKILIEYQKNEFNNKVKDFLDKYINHFLITKNVVEISMNIDLINELSINTNLKVIK